MFLQARYRLPFFVRSGCLAVVFMLVCGIVTAHVQDPDPFERKITITLREVTLRDALNTIQDAANVKFAYSTARINLNQTVSINADNVKLREVLNTLLGALRITFKADSDPNTIVLSPVTQTSKTKDDTSNTPVKGNGVSVAGIVTDATTHETLPGVNVLIKGTANGVTTDAAGKYSIQANDGELLVFSFIGYKPFEVTVGAQTVVDVALESEAKALDEFVVNAGYYSVKDKERTGSISRVSSEVLERQPVTNPLAALQGRTPGVYINQISGVPGSAFQVRIRGTNSIQNGNNPLYVIDGVPFISESLSSSNTIGLYGSQGTSPLNSINPNDIESIEILKDADATAIYGSRGANGVVLITTKKGKAGAMKADVNIRSGVSRVFNRVDLLNTQQYIAMRMEAVSNDGEAVPRSNEYDINGTWDQNRYTNWQNVLFGGTAPMTDLAASLSGGNNETQFLFGLGYNTQGTVFPGSNTANRFSTHFSIAHTSVNKKFRANISNSYTINTSNIVARDLTSVAFDLAPNAPALLNEHGDLNWENNTVFVNPMSYIKQRFDARIYNLLTNAELGFLLTRNLNIKVSVGLNDIRNEENQTNPSDTQPPVFNQTPANSTLRTSSGTIRSWIIEPQVNYEIEIAKGKLSVLAGATYQQRTYEAIGQTFSGFASNKLINDPKSATNAVLDSYNFSEYRYAAIYGRLNYIWDEKYIVNITGRRDGSSRFGPGKQFANLGAVGAAWIFSNESFIQDKLAFLSFGKLRASYGITGNDQIGDYKYLDAYTSRSPYHGITTMAPAQLFNPDYGWEVNKKLEGALELAFLNDRITFTLAYYSNRSSNQLINYKLAGTTGYPSVLRNSPAAVQNTGTEFEFGFVSINKKSFTWRTDFNITIPRNKLVSFPNLESSSYANTYIIGKPINIQKAYRYLGVDEGTGYYQFEDVNSDGNLTPDDYAAIIDLGQRHFGGLNNSFSFGRFQVEVFVQFVKQSGYRFFANGTPGWQNKNQPSFVLDDRWQQTGDVTTRQKFSRTFTAYDYQQSWYNQSDAIAGVWSFARLKNISISYELPDKLLKFVKSRIYVQGQNLFTLTDYKGLDPESGSGTFLPPLTTLIAGMQLTF